MILKVSQNLRQSIVLSLPYLFLEGEITKESTITDFQLMLRRMKSHKVSFMFKNIFFNYLIILKI